MSGGAEFRSGKQVSVACAPRTGEPASGGEGLPLLLTPGPLTTAPETRAAMSVDYGSRDPDFVRLNRRVRERLVRLVGDSSEFVAVPLQGSGTFVVEATLGTLVPREGHVLVLCNGAYGRRMADICGRIGRRATRLTAAETSPIGPAAVDVALAGDRSITHVAAVYCETTTGLLNPIEAIADVVAAHGRALLIDAMSAFGALPASASRLRFQALMASSNKCLEGLPGVGFAIARRDALEGARGQSPSLALDLSDQLARFDRDDQWRFTPPTQVMAALDVALALHQQEGGVAGRGARYRANLKALLDGMSGLGFQPLLPAEIQSPIIVTFLEPADPAYAFEAFYQALVERDFAIYPGKLTEQPTFRVGCIGQVTPEDMGSFVATVRDVLEVLGVKSGEARVA